MISLALLGRFIRSGVCLLCVFLRVSVSAVTFAYWIETPQWDEDDPIGLSRTELGGDGSVERRFLPGIPQSNYDLKPFGSGVALVDQYRTRVVFYDWDEARLLTVFDSGADTGGELAGGWDPTAPEVAAVRLGKDVLLITLAIWENDEWQTRVIDRATGAEIARYPWLAFGTFDHQGDAFLLSTADNGFVQKRVVDGAIVEEHRFALSAQLPSIGRFDAQRGWALLTDDTVVNLHAAEKTGVSAFYHQEVDVRNPVAIRWPLHRVPPPAPHFPLYEDAFFSPIAHAGENRSVILFRDYIAVFDWRSGAFEAFYARPPVNVDQISHLEGEDRFLLWKRDIGPGELYVLDLGARNVRQWGTTPHAAGLSLQNVFSLGNGRVVLDGLLPGMGNESREHRWVVNGEQVDRLTNMNGRLAGFVAEEGGSDLKGIRWLRSIDEMDRMILTEEGQVEVTTELVNGGWFFWRSPDGRFELRHTTPGGGLDLSEVGAGRQVSIPLALSNNHANALTPVWTPDGVHFLISSQRTVVSVDFATLSVRSATVPAPPPTPWWVVPVTETIRLPLIVRDGEPQWFVGSTSRAFFPGSLHDADERRSPFENVGGGRWRVGNWAHSAAFGVYAFNRAPWLYFEGFGFGYLAEGEPDWIFWPGTGWMWTNTQIAPFLYHPGFGGLFRYRDSEGTTAHFQHVGKGYWIDTQPGGIPQRLRNLVFHLYEDDEYQETHTFITDDSLRVEWVDDKEGPQQMGYSVSVQRSGTDRLRLEITSPGTLRGYYALHFDSPFGGEWEGELTVRSIHGAVLAHETGSGRFVVER